MKQSRLMSFLESCINIAVGFGISLGAQMLFLPLLGVSISFGQNFVFACIMTVISLARQFLLRRIFEALHIRRPLSPFMQAVVAERYRQIDAEGYDTQHDDDHHAGELAHAGIAYVEFAHGIHDEHDRALLGVTWPWDLESYKPTGIRRDLVKGCALIIAEGERHDRTRKRKRSVTVTASPPAQRQPEFNTAEQS